MCKQKDRGIRLFLPIFEIDLLKVKDFEGSAFPMAASLQYLNLNAAHVTLKHD